MDIPTAKQKLLARKTSLLEEMDIIDTALASLDAATALTFPNIDVIVQQNKDLTDALQISDTSLENLKALAVQNNLDPDTLSPTNNN